MGSASLTLSVDPSGTGQASGLEVFDASGALRARGIEGQGECLVSPAGRLDCGIEVDSSAEVMPGFPVAPSFHLGGQLTPGGSENDGLGGYSLGIVLPPLVDAEFGSWIATKID